MEQKRSGLLWGLILMILGSMLLLDKLGMPLWRHLIPLIYIGIIAYGFVLVSRALR